MKMKINRRSLLIQGGGALAATALAGSFPMPAIASSSKVIYWSPYDPSTTDPRARAEAAMIEIFKSQHPGIDVEVQAVPWQILGQQLMQSMLGGQGPDVALMGTTELSDQVAAGNAMPLDDYVGKDWTDVDREQFLIPWDTTVYADGKMGFNWNTVLNNWLYHNKDDFPESPLDAHEFGLKLGEAAKQTGKPGLLTSLSQEGNAVVFINWLIPLLWSAGAEYVDGEGQLGFINEGGEQTFSWLVDMIRKYEASPEAIVSLTRQNVLDAINARQGIATIAATNTVATVRQSIGDSLGLARQPGFGGPCPAFAVAKPLMMTRTAQDPVAAGLFIETMISPEAQLELSRISGELPAHGGVLSDPWFDTAEAADIRAAIEYVAEFPRSFSYPEGTSELQIAAALAAQQMVGGRPVREAMQDIEKTWQSRNQ